MAESRSFEPSYLVRDITVNVALIFLGLYLFGFLRNINLSRLSLIQMLVQVASLRLLVLYFQTLIHSMRHKRWQWFFGHVFLLVFVSVPYYFKYRAPD